MFYFMSLVFLALSLVSCKLETNTRSVPDIFTGLRGDCCYVEASKKLNIIKQNEGFDRVRLAVIIDDSWSMVQETQAVKNALIDLTPLLKNAGLPVDIEFYRISDVNSKYTTESVGSSMNKYTYVIPDPISVVQFSKSKAVSDLQFEIEQALAKAEPTDGFRVEQGLCFVTRFADWRRQHRAVNEKLVTVVVTDEDEHHKNDTKRCYSETTGPLPNHPFNVKYFLDNQGVPSFRTAITDRLLDANVDQTGSFVYVGVIYDEANNNCGVQVDGEHGENYLRLKDKMDSLELPAAIGDVCSTSYYQMIKNKIIDKYITSVQLDYKIASINEIVVMNHIYLIDDAGKRSLLNPSYYALAKQASGFYIKFSPDALDLLKQSKQFQAVFDIKE